MSNDPNSISLGTSNGAPSAPSAATTATPSAPLPSDPPQAGEQDNTQDSTQKAVFLSTERPNPEITGVPTIGGRAMNGLKALRGRVASAAAPVTHQLSKLAELDGVDIASRSYRTTERYLGETMAAVSGVARATIGAAFGIVGGAIPGLLTVSNEQVQELRMRDSEMTPIGKWTRNFERQVKGQKVGVLEIELAEAGLLDALASAPGAQVVNLPLTNSRKENLRPGGNHQIAVKGVLVPLFNAQSEKLAGYLFAEESEARTVWAYTVPQ